MDTKIIEFGKKLQELSAEFAALKGETDKPEPWLQQFGRCFCVNGDTNVWSSEFIENGNPNQFKFRETAGQVATLFKIICAVAQWREQFDNVEYTNNFKCHIYFNRKTKTFYIDSAYLSEQTAPYFSSLEKAKECLSDLRPLFEDYYGIGQVQNDK
jgi:hypothetical protein